MVKTIRIIGLVSAFVLFVSSGFSEVHPLKMSFSNLVINSDGTIVLQTRIFLDDITAEMQELYDLDTVDFSTLESDATQALQEYLSGHYYFEEDGKKSELNIDSVFFSKNRLALALFLSTDEPLDTTKEIFLTNTLLCEASEKQKNDILYLEKHYLLNTANPRMKIEFN